MQIRLVWLNQGHRRNALFAMEEHEGIIVSIQGENLILKTKFFRVTFFHFQL